MDEQHDMLSLSTIHYAAQPGFARTFVAGRLTLGLVFPIESYVGDVPTMQGQVELAQQAEAADFAALWLRDVPLRDPNFGDIGQIYDPLVYLGFIAGQTRSIALATAAIVLPVRNPLHLAKAAASIDQLSGGRLLLGVASGDRPVEFPAFGVDIARRGEIFRDYFAVLRRSQTTSFAPIRWDGGSLEGADMIPKPVAEEIPLLITGNSRQTPAWIAANGHGWISYPRPPNQQAIVVSAWREAVREHCGETFKPFIQSLYLNLAADPDTPPQPIHLGYRMGRDYLIRFLQLLQNIGVNHLMINLRFNERSALEIVEELREHILPLFPSLAARPFGAP